MSKASATARWRFCSSREDAEDTIARWTLNCKPISVATVCTTFCCAKYIRMLPTTLLQPSSLLLSYFFETGIRSVICEYFPPMQSLWCFYYYLYFKRAHSIIEIIKFMLTKKLNYFYIV